MWRGRPLSSISTCDRYVASPPMPLPKMTPVRSFVSWGSSPSSPASSTAWSAAASASCEKRSRRCAALRPRYPTGSNPLTSHANRVPKCSASNSVMGPAPLSPRMRASQNCSTLFPRGFRVPIPVTTTLRPCCMAYGRVDRLLTVRWRIGGSSSGCDESPGNPARNRAVGRLETSRASGSARVPARCPPQGQTLQMGPPVRDRLTRSFPRGSSRRRPPWLSFPHPRRGS